MMDFLYQIDVMLFRFINGTLANPLFDWLMPIVTEEDNWRIPILLIVLAFLIFGGRKGRITILLLIFVITMSDQISSFVIKPLFSRVRPCFVLDNVRLLIDQSGSPSFTSSHAANLAAMAMLFSWRYRRRMWLPISLALFISYSRIYVGVHYPSDILGGWIIGIFCATVVLLVRYGIETGWRKWRAGREHEK
jgi:undecaprenyl-diphosphatase